MKQAAERTKLRSLDRTKLLGELRKAERLVADTHAAALSGRGGQLRARRQARQHLARVYTILGEQAQREE